MNAKCCSGRESKVENRKQYGKNLFHYGDKVKNIRETVVIKFCIVVIKFWLIKNPLKNIQRIFVLYAHRRVSRFYSLNSNFTLKKRPVRRTGTGYI